MCDKLRSNVRVDEHARRPARGALGVEGMLQNDCGGHLIDHRTCLFGVLAGCTQCGMGGDGRQPFVHEPHRQLTAKELRAKAAGAIEAFDPAWLAPLTAE